MINKIVNFEKSSKKSAVGLLSTLTARVQLLNSYISAGETDSTLITSNQYHSESQLDQEIQISASTNSLCA